jgi:predicted HicB family RNase H-like nuclease
MTVRLPADLHARLRERAACEERPLNTQIVRLLRQARE